MSRGTVHLCANDPAHRAHDDVDLARRRERPRRQGYRQQEFPDVPPSRKLPPAFISKLSPRAI